MGNCEKCVCCEVSPLTTTRVCVSGKEYLFCKECYAFYTDVIDKIRKSADITGAKTAEREGTK